MFFKRSPGIALSRDPFDRGFVSGLLAGILLTVFLTTLIAAISFLPIPSIGWAAVQTEQHDASRRADEGVVELPQIGQIRRDLKSFVKRSKVKDDDLARAGAIVDLCLLHQEIVNDPRFGTNDQLKGFRAVAASRLKSCQKELQLEQKRRTREAAQNARDQTSDLDESQSAGGSSASLGSERKMSFQTYREVVASEFESMSQFTGGPIRIWSHVGGNYGPQGDYGQQLVELIQSTINPDFWRANGGEGIIHYYRPSCILVVGATSKVHDDLTDMLRTLRRSSR